MGYLLVLALICLIAFFFYAKRPLKPTVIVEGRLIRNTIQILPNGDTLIGVETPNQEVVSLLYETRKKSFCIHPVDATCYHGGATMLSFGMEFGGAFRIRTLDREGKTRKVYGGAPTNRRETSA